MPRHPKQVVDRLFAGINAGNPNIFQEVYHEDAEIDWPQFGERIHGAVDRQKVFESLPTKPDVHVRRVFGDGGLWIIEALLVYAGEEHFSVSILEFKGDRIKRETTYWADPKPGGAGWKARWVHPLEAISRVPEPEDLE